MAYAPRPIEPDDLERRFAFHPVTDPDVGATHSRVRTLCLELAHDLVANMPPGREASLAITSLEETMMWANAAIARGLSA